MIWLWMLLSCSDPPEPPASSAPDPTASSADSEATAELPAPIRDPQRARGSMLRYGTIEGYRSRRLDFTGSSALLVRGDPRSPAHQREADLLAETPALVLLVDHSSDLHAAEAYLLAIEGILSVEIRSLDRAETP